AVVAVPRHARGHRPGDRRRPAVAARPAVRCRAMARKKLGEMLVEAGILSDASLQHALHEQRRWGGTLGRTLVEMRLVREEDLLGVLSRQFGVPVIDLDRIAIPSAVLELVPGDLAQELSVVPFAQ